MLLRKSLAAGEATLVPFAGRELPDSGDVPSPPQPWSGELLLTDELIAAAVEAGSSVVPTLINIDNFPQIALGGAEKFPAYAAHMRALFATSRERIRSAYDAGVPVYTGTDAGGSLPHGLIRDEIRALVGAGIPQPYVIAQASWNGRAWLGLPGLEEGALPDLVVYDEDPRTELGTLYAPRRTILRGAVVA